MTAQTEIAKIELKNFYNEFEALKAKELLSQVTSQEFLKELTKVTSVVKPKRAKKPKEAAKYKRITVEQFNSYQQWLDSEAEKPRKFYSIAMGIEEHAHENLIIDGISYKFVKGATCWKASDIN